MSTDLSTPVLLRRIAQLDGASSPCIPFFSADGKHLWLSGRYDDVVYRFDTTSGAVDFVAVGKQPHGLAVWPQPGR